MCAGYGDERGYPILKHRYGLEGAPTYTLDEIGNFYGISRERARQLEKRAKDRLGAALTGKDDLGEVSVPEPFREEAQELLRELSSLGALAHDSAIRGLIISRYGPAAAQCDGNLTLLLEVLGLKPIPPDYVGLPAGGARVWTSEGGASDFKKLKPITSFLRRYLREQVRSVSEFELTVELNRTLRSPAQGPDVRLALKICPDVEPVGEDEYRIRFNELASLASKAGRLLAEAGQPLHYKDLAREISRLALAERLPRLRQTAALRAQLSASPDFKAVGRSGKWALASWEHVRVESIAELMQDALAAHGRSLSLEEVFDHVRQGRPDVRKATIQALVSMREDLFQRDSRGRVRLVAWGGFPRPTGRRRSDARPNRSPRGLKMEELILEYLAQAPRNEALVREVRDYVVEETGAKHPTFYRVLSELPEVRKKETADGLVCYLRQSEPP